MKKWLGEARMMMDRPLKKQASHASFKNLMLLLSLHSIKEQQGKETLL